MRRWLILALLLLPATAWAQNISVNGTVSQGIAELKGKTSAALSAANRCRLYYDTGQGGLLASCNGGAYKFVVGSAVSSCVEDASGNLTCNTINSLDQNGLTVPAANRWRLLDNDVDLTPDPSCTDYGQSGLMTILDIDESAVDDYVLCDGQTQLWHVSYAGNPTTWFAPYGLGSTTNTELLAANTCTCWLYPQPQAMLDLDTIAVVVTDSDGDAQETTTIGVYSLNGATQYFTGTLTDTATGNVATTNGTAAPGIMYPGTYWLCFGHNAPATNELLLRSAAQDAIRTGTFTQACASGTLPATLTTPTVTMANKYVPAVVLTND